MRVNRSRPGLWGDWLGNRWLYPEADARNLAPLPGEVDFTASLGSNVKMGLQGAPIKTILLFMKNPVFVLTAQPEFTTVEWSGLLGGLQAGKYDVIVNQVAATDKRRETFDTCFSRI